MSGCRETKWRLVVWFQPRSIAMSVTTFFFVMIAITVISKTITAEIKRRKEADLLERNPEGWKKVKEVELEKTDRKRRAIGGAVFNIFFCIFKVFLKR
jgi:hypothetical protein